VSNVDPVTCTHLQNNSRESALAGSDMPFSAPVHASIPCPIGLSLKNVTLRRRHPHKPRFFR